MSFTYNDEGIRTSKTADRITTNYYYSGSQLIAEETRGNITVYLYDAAGSVIGMQYHASGSTSTAWDSYWFEKNLQGDIVAIYNASGTKLVSYTYDAWGNFNATNVVTEVPFAVENNPFTYRGYYYDYDLGLYYLQSRYYDSNVGRFLNVDGYVSTGQGLLGYNMYAYCNNNPVKYVDQGGKSPIAVVALVVLGIYLLTNLTSSEKQEPSEEEIQKAEEYADSIKGKPYDDRQTVDISFKAQDFLDNVDEDAREYFYQRLYDNSIQTAKTHGIGTDNLMDVDHIRWETEWHLFAHKLDISNADDIDLDVEETRWSMIKRGLEYLEQYINGYKGDVWFLYTT